jgi:D-sedoheptulose 7-phosphate isomerase
MDRVNNIDYLKNIIVKSIETKKLLLEDEDVLQKTIEVVNAILSALKKGNKVLLAGNGGSAADAQHIAAEFVSRFEFDRAPLAAVALTTDTSILTAIGNDYGYEHLFSRQLRAIGREGDVFIGISTSGNSKNVVEAINACKSLGITSVGLTGNRGAMLDICDHLISVPSNNTARIQESHILIGHSICSMVESGFFGG